VSEGGNSAGALTDRIVALGSTGVSFVARSTSIRFLAFDGVAFVARSTSIRSLAFDGNLSTRKMIFDEYFGSARFIARYSWS